MYSVGLNISLVCMSEKGVLVSGTVISCTWTVVGDFYRNKSNLLAPCGCWRMSAAFEAVRLFIGPSI